MMANRLYLLLLYCGFGFAIQSYHSYITRTQNDLIINDFQIKLLNVRDPEYMSSAALYSSPEQHIEPLSASPHSFGRGGISPKSKPVKSTKARTKTEAVHDFTDDLKSNRLSSITENNDDYPSTPSLKVTKFRFGVITDLDENTAGEIALGSNAKGASRLWVAYLKQGTLSIQYIRDNPDNSNVTIKWDTGNPRIILSGQNYAGRGMELSTLNFFNSKLLACCDKTGILYELRNIDNKYSSEVVPVPWVILADKNSTIPKGYQCEWATIKDKDLWVGSHGINELNEFGEETLAKPRKTVVRVSPDGTVTNLDWSKNFDRMRDALNVPTSGYVRHESGLWSQIQKKWVFMPRRVSSEKYNLSSFGKSGSNVVVIADENFKYTQVHRIGKLIPTLGFTDSKFIPGTGDRIIVAIKVIETQDVVESYLMAFDLNGNILLPETKFSDQKYEGIEFL